MEFRKIKDLIGALMAYSAVIFLIALVFVPFHYSVYISSIFKFLLIILPFYLISEIYYFVKDTPKRRESKKKEKTKKEKITSTLEYTFLAALIIIILLARNGTILKKECPEIVQGNPNTELAIKYFFNPFCPSCWKQEKIVQNTLKRYGDNIRLERYDYRYCSTVWSQLGLKHIPAFSFGVANKTNNFGPLDDEKLSSLICEKIECET